MSKKVRTATGERAVVVVPRLSYRECLTPVRSLYLDLAHWAVEDPERWGAWVAPCPVGEAEVDLRKGARQRKSRMDQRTRERLPALPSLVRAVDEARKANSDVARGRPSGRARRGLQPCRVDLRQARES